MRAGHLQVAAAASLWGLWSLFFRTAERLGPTSPALEGLVVFAVVAVAAAPSALRHRAPARRPLLAWVGLAVHGACDAANAVFFFTAMQRTSVAVAVLTHYLAPIFVALAAPLVFRDRLRRSTVGALAVSLAGLVLLLQPWTARGAGGWSGALLGAASAVFYAASLLFGKGLQRWFGVSEILAWHFGAGVPLLAFFVPAGGFAVGLPSLVVLLAGGLAGGVLANVLFLRGLSKVPAPQAGVLTLVEPVVAVLVGAVVWKEVPGPLSLAGAAAVLLGAWLVIRPRGPGSP